MNNEDYLHLRRAIDIMKTEPQEKLEFLDKVQKIEDVKALSPWQAFPHSPIEYAEFVFGAQLTNDQKNIVKALMNPPYKVHVDSGHSTGKTYIAAIIANWHYDSFSHGVTVTTAPKYEHIVNVLWGEIRRLRLIAKQKWPNYPMPFPRSPEMRDSPDHYALGLTAEKGEGFQGRHMEHMCFIFDESEGLERTYFTATSSMFQPSGKHFWLSICNPTTRTSPVYLETNRTDFKGELAWKLFRLSCLDHPNIEREMRGLPPLIPSAITMGQIENMMHDYKCMPVPQGEQQVTDFEWPKGSNNWFRPGPLGEARILGLRPTQGSDSIWSDALWSACESMPLEALPFPLMQFPELGCDVARVLGGDDCCIVGHWGGVVLVFDEANGRSIPATAQKLKELAGWLCDFANSKREHLFAKGVRKFFPNKIPIKIDDGNVGGALIDLADGYNFIPVNSANTANMELKYPNVRSELWFETESRARLGGISLAFLKDRDELAVQKLKIQAISPMWSTDSRGRRVVEKKEITKQRLGRSPDAMDAFNLAMYLVGQGTAEWIGLSQQDFQNESMAQRMGIYGREGKSLEEKREEFEKKRAGLESDEEDSGMRSHSPAVRVLGRGLR